MAGQDAHVVVANPHGITCDGCGFLNTPPVPFSPLTFPLLRYQLSVLDENGQTARLEFSLGD